MPGERVTPGPRGFHVHLTVRDLVAAVDFYQRVFGARVLLTDAPAEGAPGFAEVVIGGIAVVVSEESVHYDYSPSPASLGGSPVLLTLHYDDPRAVFDAALDAGGEVELPFEEEVPGDGYGIVCDVEGHRWALKSARRRAPEPDPAPPGPVDAEPSRESGGPAESQEQDKSHEQAESRDLAAERELAGSGQ
ncbi:VOC family protein [Sinosporangium siamense]|uniref:VOC domain-containing protein n=1 Tax=Sinosporangium siamense TaxID=1367973 RepID=A0A919RIQ7_9ACTN|nr:VOC family protein [Sinosporangium siamense]GII92726.1 hypothetical protein Ssi02_29570 [Sinosporangium siamense]